MIFFVIGQNRKMVWLCLWDIPDPLSFQRSQRFSAASMRAFSQADTSSQARLWYLVIFGDVKRLIEVCVVRLKVYAG